MTASWDDEYLTVAEIAEHLKLNPQTIRNWIDGGTLPAVRIGRRVRVRRVDLDRILAQGTTAAAEPDPSPPGPSPAVRADALEQLDQAHQRARRLLGRRSAARRAELADGLQQLTEAVATALAAFSEASDQTAAEGKPG